MNTREKIVPLDALAERVCELANQKTKVIVASGRFDLLSRELVEELHAARSGDCVLVAAVEPNPSPACVLTADARAELAAGLADVDWVVVERAEAVRRGLGRAETVELKFDLASRLLAKFRGHVRA